MKDNNKLNLISIIVAALLSGGLFANEETALRIIPDNPNLTGSIVTKAVERARKSSFPTGMLTITTIAYTDTKAIYNPSLAIHAEENISNQKPKYFVRVEPKSGGGCLMTVSPDNLKITRSRCATTTDEYNRLLHTAYAVF